MNGWRSGDLISAGAGLVVLAGSALPWLLRETPGERVAQTAAGPANLVATTLIVGLALLVSGATRTSWTGVVALLGGLACGIVVFAGTIPAHAAGAHPGFGLFAIGAGGVLAVAGGVLNAIERDEGAL